MYGFEYQAAVHMIQEGLIQEGLEIVHAVRARFDGERRNPWNEFECGSNYARSMASYALLNAFGGISFDMTRCSVGFAPLRTGEGPFRIFWSLDSGWGVFTSQGGMAELSVLYGSLSLSRFMLRENGLGFAEEVTLGEKSAVFKHEGDTLVFNRKLLLEPGRSLKIRYREV